MTSASCTAWSHSYTYDKVGNITAKDGITYTINTVNEVTSLSDGTAFTYDYNGNRIEKTKGTDTWDYTYDYANRLTQVKENDTVDGEYIYDGDSRRLQVTEDNVTTTFIYSGLNILYEENTTGTATYIYGSTGRIAKRTTVQGESDTFYYHADHLGSTRLVTDESGTIAEDVRYHPFGEAITNGEESCLYTGKERDPTGLYYYGARYYDSDLGRFITRDPVTGRNTSLQTLNRYSYCVNNPTKMIDPVGLAERLCNVDTGICTRFRYGKSSHDSDIPEWTAYNEKGEKITDSNEVFGCSDGVFYCLDAEKGELLWKIESEKRTACPPIIADNKVVFGNVDGMLYIVDSKSGKICETADFGVNGVMSLAISDGRLYVGQDDGTIICFEEPPLRKEVFILSAAALALIFIVVFWYRRRI
ncbi:MAG: RHS repeat-associated core domain-containing protein [Candidatus Methanofastidiosia archaeon]